MTNLKVYLNDGNVITTQMETYDVATITSILNDQRTLMVPIGNAIINKNAIKMVIPESALTSN
jgi:sRNA-binding regulator protein Hfq